MAAGHTHPVAGGPDDGAETVAFDWFRALDLVIWSAVVVLAALGLEWFFGAFIRERIHGQAMRVLADDVPTEAK
jgi:hypothetical protein